MLVEGLQPGGQLTITTDVENYPGFADVIQGPWLMEQMRAQAAHVGTQIVSDTIVSVDLAARPFRCVGDSGDIYEGETLIIATGAQARWLGLPSEEKFRGFGVSACATCDGFFFRGKEGRDRRRRQHRGRGSALSHQPRHQGDADPSPRYAARREDHAGPAVRQSEDQGGVGQRGREMLGGGEPPGVTGVRMRNVKTGAVSELTVDGVFVAIGHEPATALFTGQLDDGRRRLYRHPARQHRNLDSRRVCRRRREGQGVSPGGDGGGHGLHGRARGRTLHRCAEARRPAAE